MSNLIYITLPFILYYFFLVLVFFFEYVVFFFVVVVFFLDVVVTGLRTSMVRRFLVRCLMLPVLARAQHSSHRL